MECSEQMFDECFVLRAVNNSKQNKKPSPKVVNEKDKKNETYNCLRYSTFCKDLFLIHIGRVKILQTIRSI
jgi:hypothetical protein